MDAFPPVGDDIVKHLIEELLKQPCGLYASLKQKELGLMHPNTICNMAKAHHKKREQWTSSQFAYASSAMKLTIVGNHFATLVMDLGSIMTFITDRNVFLD